MQNLSFNQAETIYKKGRIILGCLPFFIFTASCSGDLSQYGRVTQNGAGNKSSFVFSVSEEYLKKNQDSPKDELNPKMTKAESALLLKLLKQQKYCLNDEGKTLFAITSKQEKIYDMTFAHLIEQNYNARPLSPRTYYGQCMK